MADLKKQENVIAIDVQENEKGDPNLIIGYPNPLDESDIQERNIRLWSTNKDKEVDSDIIENTERNLRESLGDESITYSPNPNQAEDTDIRNWLKEHPKAPMKDVYQNGIYFQIGAGMRDSAFGDSKYLRTHKATDGPYNPEEHRKLFFDAQSDEVQEHLKSGTPLNTETASVYSNKKTGRTGASLNHRIHDIILTSANAFGQESTPMNREEFLTNVIEMYILAKDVSANELQKEDVEDFLEKVKAEPSKYGYKAMIRFFGGSDMPKLPKKIRTNVSGMLKDSTRTTAALYVKNPDTGYIYKTSNVTPKGDFATFEPNFLEFFTNDISRNDVTDFLGNLDIPDFADAASEALSEVLDGDIANLDDPNFNDKDVPTNVLALMRKLLVGREIQVTTSVNSDNDMTRLGSYIRSVGEKKPFVEPKQQQSQEEPEVPDDLFEEKEEAPKANSNPFETQEEINEKKDKPKSDNPFEAFD